MRRKSNGLWIGTRKGVETPRPVKRIPVQRGWGEDCVNWVQFAPGGIARCLGDKVEWEADHKHREKVLEYFGMDEGSRALNCNGEKNVKEEDGDEEKLEKEEAKVYRGLAARLNFMSQDCPDLQFPIKPCSREMAKPTRGSWRHLKKVGRYLMNRERVVWEK